MTCPCTRRDADALSPFGPLVHAARAVLLLGALLHAGCQQAGHTIPVTAPAIPLASEIEADADPDDLPPPPPETPVTLISTVPPTYSAPIVPSRPEAIGKLDVPVDLRWKYIVIHHSFTRSGSEAAFDRYHKQRGWLGVGYHFVIGNGHGSPDGAIEVTFRWERQLHGAHAGVQEYNQHGIGICLVGNFNEAYPTARQMASLVALVNYLQDRCRIPSSGILLHRHIKSTECPGRYFPFYRFVSLLQH